MVKGLDVFQQYFEAYPDNYVIIGGTALDIVIGEAGLNPRATKDIDLILVVEALTPAFVEQFWGFIKDGAYEQQEKSSDERKYYRFMKPANPAFPYQVELFSRKPELVDLEEPAHLTPIPAQEDLSSLSAILMNDIYYEFMTGHSVLENGLRRANVEALICLKAKAYHEIKDRNAKGGKEGEKNVRKHKADIFRLGALLPATADFELPAAVQADLDAFAREVADDLPDKAIFKEMGVANLNPAVVFDQLVKSFRITL